MHRTVILSLTISPGLKSVRRFDLTGGSIAVCFFFPFFLAELLLILPHVAMTNGMMAGNEIDTQDFAGRALAMETRAKSIGMGGLLRYGCPANCGDDAVINASFAGTPVRPSSSRKAYNNRSSRIKCNSHTDGPRIACSN